MINFVVKGPIPRTAPYKKFRSHLYVPGDVRKWRRKIADAFIKAGGVKPKKSERVFVTAIFFMIKNHCDIDSIYHSLQDALSKDALRVSDKHWSHHALLSQPFASTKRNECVDIKVEYHAVST